MVFIICNCISLHGDTMQKDELKSNGNPIYSKEEYTDGFSRTVRVFDADGNLVFKYCQKIEFSEKLTDDDLAFAQKSLDNAQKEFLQSMKGSY